MPSVWASGEDVDFKTGNNTKVVACAFHCPQQIAVARFVYANGSAVGQNDIELANVVTNHAVETFMTSMATPKTGTHQPDTITGAGGGNVTVIPKVLRNLTVVDAASKPGRFAAWLDADVPEFCHVNLDPVEGSQTLSVAMATVYGKEFEAVFIAVFDLYSGQRLEFG
jgi:hypothetical protein